MSDDSSAVSSLSLSKPKTRGRLLALMGAGGGALLASLFSRNGAQAGHDGTNVLHLGESNQVPAGALTAVAMDVNNFPALQIKNLNSGPFSSTMRVMGSGSTPVITVESDASAGAPGGNVVAVHGVSSGPGFGEAGQFGEGNGTGVQGTSRSGAGVVGFSVEGTGGSGHSDSGVGGSFFSNSGLGLTVAGPANVAVNAIRPRSASRTRAQATSPADSMSPPAAGSRRSLARPRGRTITGASASRERLGRRRRWAKGLVQASRGSEGPASVSWKLRRRLRRLRARRGQRALVLRCRRPLCALPRREGGSRG